MTLGFIFYILMTLTALSVKGSFTYLLIVEYRKSLGDYIFLKHNRRQNILNSNQEKQVRER